MTFRYVPSGRVQPMGKVRSFIKRVPEQSVSQSTNPYYIGQEFYGIAFSYKNKDRSSYSLPMVWDDEYPSITHILKLTIKEQRVVANESNTKPEPSKYLDNYLLEDERGRIFCINRANIFIENIDDNFEERLKTDKKDPSEYILITDLYAKVCSGARCLTRLLTENLDTDNTLQDLHYGAALNKKRLGLEFLREEIENKFAIISGGKVIYAKSRFRDIFMKGCIANTTEEAWGDMYVPVMTDHELVKEVKKVKRYRVNPRKRVLPGFYIRIYSSTPTGYLNFESSILGGYESFERYRGRHGKPIYTPKVTGRYRLISSNQKGRLKETLKNSHGCFISDQAHSSILLANSTDVQNLRLVLAKHHVTGFELGVLFKGWPDTKERFIKYMEDKAFFNYIDKPH